MGKKFLLATLVLLAIAIPILAASPVAGEVTLRLRDAQQRPVPNATVVFEYTFTDPVLGELRKTDQLTSDSTGIIRHRLSVDFGTQCKITVSRNLASETVIINWVGTTERFVELPLSDFTIRVVDTDGNQLSNVPLRFESERGTFDSATNATGFKIFTQYYNGMDYDVFARYGEREYSIRLRPDGRQHSIQIPTYSLEIRTLDDRGRSLETHMALTYLAVGEVTKQTYGIAGLFTQVPEGNATLAVSRGAREITKSIYVNSSIRHIIVFDETPPSISTPWTIPINPVPENEVQVFVNVSEEGEYATGLPASVEGSTPVLINYSINGIDWVSGKMMPEPSLGEGAYMARLPGFPPDSVVRYTISAEDSAGNIATSPQYTFNTVVQRDGGGAGGGEDEFQALSFLWIVPVALVIIGLAYLVKKRYF